MKNKNALFNETTIKRLVENVNPTAKQKKASKEWIDLMQKGILMKEKQGYLKFYDIILKDLLGYENIKHEKEGVEFSYERDNKPIVRIEAKGMDTRDLFLPQKRAREESPVQQVWRYMQLHASPYGIVTNYQTFILFKYNVGSQKYHEFNFQEIKINPDKLKEFIAIFSKESIDNNFVEKLYEKSIIEEREFTKEFYKLYHETRLMLIKDFEANDEKITRAGSVHFAQLYLNRLMFAFFAEDTGKLKRRVIEEKILNMLDRNKDLLSIHTHFISDIIKGLFTDLDKGNPPEVFGFNGGLFSNAIPPRVLFKDFKDKKLFAGIIQNSRLKKKKIELNQKEKEIFEKYENKLNPIIKNILLMASFDFNTEVNVNILGHIFEQSISDIEDLKAEKSSRRKKEGIFYTPEYITDYICRNTIIPYLSEKGVNSVPDLIKEYAENIGELEEKFKKIKILDPACGSGAFLIKATDIMLEIFKSIQDFKQSEGDYKAKRGLKRKSNTQGQLVLTKWHEEDEAREIILNSIHGVDINEESVEITKLALFLKMARKNRKLTNLSNNIKQGNSLIDEEDVAGRLAFNWNKEFPDIMNNGGFDVVVGNPPYVFTRDVKFGDKLKRYIADNYLNAKDSISKSHARQSGKINLYSLFLIKGRDLLKEKGLISFIVPNNILRTTTYDIVRKQLLDNFEISEIVDLGAGIFEGVTASTIIIKMKKNINEEERNKNLVEVISNFKDLRNKNKIIQNDFINNTSYAFNIISNTSDRKILDKIENNCIDMGEVTIIHAGGIATGPNKKGMIKDHKKSEKHKPMLEGKDIKAFYPIFSNRYILYDRKLLYRAREESIFLNPEKLITQRISGGLKPLVTSYDNEKYYTFNSTNTILSKDKNYSLKYILTLLNSKLINWYYVNKFTNKSNLTVNISKTFLEKIPIKQIPLSEQKPFIEKADLMLKLNKEFYEKKDKFLKLIRHEYGIEKISRKLDKFYELEFDDFMKQLKVNLNMNKKSELLDFFEKNKKELSKLKEEMDNTDREIDEMVYQLYGLTDEEIGIVEVR